MNFEHSYMHLCLSTFFRSIYAKFKRWAMVRSLLPMKRAKSRFMKLPALLHARPCLSLWPVSIALYGYVLFALNNEIELCFNFNWTKLFHIWVTSLLPNCRVYAMQHQFCSRISLILVRANVSVYWQHQFRLHRHKIRRQASNCD